MHCGHASPAARYEAFVHYVAATALRHACEALPNATYDVLLRQLADTTIHRCTKKVFLL
jgi:hypothetical protein